MLVDHSRRELYNSKMYALNVDGSLIVKRVRRVRGGWVAESDNPLHESFDLKEPYAVIGRVVWRAHTEWRR